MKAGLAFEPAVTKKVIIDSSFSGVEAQARGQEVLELFPDKFGVGLFGFHGDPRKLKVGSRKKRKIGNKEHTEAAAQVTQRGGQTDRKKKGREGCPPTAGKLAMQEACEVRAAWSPRCGALRK